VPASLRDLRLLLDDFVDGAPLWDFWNSFVEHGETFDADAALSPAGRRLYDEVYELVYLSVPDAAVTGDDGHTRERALRERLRDVRFETADGRQA
jgi:hypothetical protein